MSKDKQILISSGDRGIVFEIQVTDNKNKAVPIVGDVITAYFVHEGGSQLTKKSSDSEIEVLDPSSGLIQLTLEKENTTLLGNYSVYVELQTLDYEISTTSAFNYYVVAKNGGN